MTVWFRMSGPSGRTLATSLIAQGLLLVTGVVAARALGVTGRGDLALLWIAPAAVAAIGGLGLPQATAYFIAEAGAPEEKWPVIRAAIRLALPIGTVLSALYLALVTNLTGADSEMRTPALISSGLVLLIYLQALGIGVLQGMQEFGRYNLFRVMPLVIYAPLAASALLLEVATLTSLIAMFLVSLAIGTGLTWLSVLRFAERAGPEEAKEGLSAGRLLSFGIRGLLGDSYIAEQIRLDQLVVGLLVNARGLGLYASGAAFSYLSRFVAQGIGAVAFPRIASARRGSEQWGLARRALLIGGSGVLLVTMALEVLLPLLVELLFGEAFLGAVPIGRVLLLAGALFALKRLLTDIMRGLGRPGYGSLAELAGLVVFALTLTIFFLTKGLTAEGVAWIVTLSGLAGLAPLVIPLARLRSHLTA